ncbi:MAG: quinolinate synthase NadA [Deltaproteobacteria bacterium]|jgi:quinolinate synthase|nr:quinolinate synthase NadA [Deltaproteobacteria bacterium]
MQPVQPPIPVEYLEAEEKNLVARIQARKREFGRQLLILGHHYQQEAVFQCADMVGDSLKLARQAAAAKEARYIVFCGVHFMAEAADILTDADQAVFLPHLQAGCPMADMATVDQVAHAWQELAGVCPHDRLVPVTYVNSSAAIKAFVGERGGSVCTSSNAERVLAWALERGDKIFFFPDEHLGRNSAKALGLRDEEIVLWQRGRPLGGNSPEELQRARVLLWNGSCEVHMEFSAEQIARWRRQEPAIQVIIHPESNHEAVAAADQYGSTEAIIAAIKNSRPGSVWAVGTEVNLVKRLQQQHPDKTIHLLAPTPCCCKTMALVTPASLLWLLDNLAQGNLVNQIKVAPEIAQGARLALDRMLEI